MKKILIVDDEEKIRELIKINLELVGYETIEASDGIKALELVDDEKLDLQLNLYIKEFENIDKTINDTVENTKDEYMDVIKYISDYYKEKNIYLAYYSNNQLLYGSNKSIKLKNKDLLKAMKYNVVIEKHNNRYYSIDIINQ